MQTPTYWNSRDELQDVLQLFSSQPQCQPCTSNTDLQQFEKLETDDDRSRRLHVHGTGGAVGRNCIASCPGSNTGEKTRMRRQDHGRAADVRGRAGGPAVDTCRTGGDAATAESQESALVGNRQREARHIDSERGGIANRTAG